jgi:hypothetical protein
LSFWSVVVLKLIILCTDVCNWLRILLPLLSNLFCSWCWVKLLQTCFLLFQNNLNLRVCCC